ncbi:ubiquitin carboxyl-terminal hydrolase 40 isoform X2 [Strongylocentrotus purpuratus]|uniref:USP domain-containing protein n=1 Tax=Strongylocentrotus purpuratus TaxID=7668 RepID=A0A7M7P5V4_STRPU|nr:ubiquitin carboxyl-terminal hydrolase 40 isoform X2 [Strongylocentrotus purpuratus]
MFGDLFGEEGETSSDVASQNSAQRSSKKDGLPQPPLLRGSTGLAGIANQGATCYLNSLLQTLLFTPEFRESLFALGQDELGNIADKEKPGSKVRVIPIHLQRLFARLLLLNQRSATTEELTDSFGWTNREELQQHDVQELSRILFCAIEDSLVGTSGEHLISRLYRGSIVNQITCEECNRISERPEDFVDLTLAVGGYIGVVDTLRAYYVEEERMEGSNQYRCDRCKKLVNARKGAKLRSLPPILTISLLRFSYDFVKLERFKETGHYTFPLELDMAPYCEQVKEEALYELYSVVLHSGSTHGGHYHAYIRDVDNLGTWSEPHKELIQLTPDSGSGKDDIIDMKSPQQCLTALLRKHGGSEHVLSVENLCQVLNQETGVSWNKRFKRQYGTMTKFLRKYNDLFELNTAGSLVHLVDPMKGKASSPDQSPSKSPRDGARQDNTNAASDENHVKEEGGEEGQDQSNKERAIARATAKIPEPGQCWYDFNDSSVEPIRENALYRQFQGRESAYMLLYRRKTMTRPTEAYNNAYHQMPAWLMAELETANQELEKQREEYDRSINSVELSLLLSSHCIWARGALQLAPDREPVKITLDRRKTITHLMGLIKEQVPEDNNECLHVAKSLPAGFHLFDSLTDSPDKTLQDCYVTDQSFIFLWDGKQVDGNSILVGPTSEPILLILTYNAAPPSNTSTKPTPPPPSSPTELPHGFPKDTRISELRCMVSDIVGIPKHRLKLSRVQSVPVVVSSEDDGRTLTQLDFSDGDKLMVESTGKDSPKSPRDSLAAREADNQKNSVKLTIENRCVDPDHNGDWPVKQMDIPKDKTVFDLKQLIINTLGLYGNQRPKEGCRLRISDDAMGLLAPLHENKSLTDSGVKKGKTIVIETGLPPTSNELTLNFSLMSGTKSWDMMVDKSTSMSECLTKMLSIAGMEGTPYHLRKTNWCGEAADIITDMEQSLLQLHIQDGELLMLEEGRIPPRGFLLLPVWLCPSPRRTSGAEEGGGGGVSSWMPHVQFSNILNSLSSANSPNHDIQQSLETPSNQHELLGEIEISQNATIGDLKSQVMTLPAMSQVVVPTVEFLRLRLLEDGRQGRVLRDNNQSLKFARMNISQIAVQILPEEEHLRQTEFVLTFQKRIPDTRLYGTAEDLVWDAGKSAAPSGLRQAIADRLLIPVERVALAKHFTKKAEWIVIPEDKKVSETGKGRGGGKKKGKAQTHKAINLKHAPYLLRDGDVFGVVDLKDDPFRKDDFTTIEDDREKERKEEVEQEKRRNRRDRRNAVSLGGGESKEKSKKRQEIGLMIKVDNFR